MMYMPLKHNFFIDDDDRHTRIIGNYEMMFKCMEGSCYTHAYSFVAM